MLKFIKKLLSSILWLATCLMTGMFWVNIEYGFNVFSIQHWEYLGQLQATGGVVMREFYLSLVITIIIALLGFYLILRTRKPKTGTNLVVVPNNKKFEQIKIDEKDIASKKISDDFVRPMRLNIPSSSTVSAPNNPAVGAPLKPNNEIMTKNLINDLIGLFKGAGYTIKPTPKIGGIIPDLFAVGNNEILWIGAHDIEAVQMKSAVDAILELFSEALDEDDIDIRPFILSPKSRNENMGIMYFDSISDVKAYIENNPNSDEDPNHPDNMFNDFSNFVDVLIKHFNANK